MCVFILTMFSLPLEGKMEREDIVSLYSRIEQMKETDPRCKGSIEAVWTAEDERAAVVAWLRKEAVSHRRDGFPIAAYTMQERADAIERGEHCREEKP